MYIDNLSEEKIIYKDYFNQSQSRHILRYQWIKNVFLKNISDKKFLEIGCGDGGVIQLLKNNNYVIGLDISLNGIEFLKKKGIESYCVDINEEKIPFPDGFFDYVLIFEVFEHLKCPYNAIVEIQRVCKKNGIILLSIPNYRTGHKFLYSPLFTFKSFEIYLKEQGFKLLSKKPYGICSPFWSLIKKAVQIFLKKPLNNNNKNNENIHFTTKMARYLSSGLFLYLIPLHYRWLLVYKLSNINPSGAKKLFLSIAEETKNAYR